MVSSTSLDDTTGLVITDGDSDPQIQSHAGVAVFVKEDLSFRSLAKF